MSQCSETTVHDLSMYKMHTRSLNFHGKSYLFVVPPPSAPEQFLGKQHVNTTICLRVSYQKELLFFAPVIIRPLPGTQRTLGTNGPQPVFNNIEEEKYSPAKLS